MSVVSSDADPQLPSLPVPAAPIAVPAAVASERMTPPPAPPAPRWKPITSSRRRRLANAGIFVVVLGALGVGGWFTYQSLAPADDTTTPTTLLRDNPDNVFGQANDAVRRTNEQMQQEQIEELLGATSVAP